MSTPQEGLKDSQLHAILANIQDALIATDPDGVVIYMNDAAHHLYGFEDGTDENLENLDLQRYVLDTFEVRTLAGDPVADDDRPLLRALRGESYDNVELLVRHRNLDETRVFVYSGRASDVPSIRVLKIRDETDRWKAERRYRTAFEADPAPSLITRLEDEQILQANTGMKEMLGSEKSDIIGSRLSDLEMLARNGELSKSLAEMRTGERIHKQKMAISHPDNGKAMNVLVSARAIEIDGEPCGIFTFIDVTELERSQRENITAQEDLARARSRLAEQRESERARIARDLHDGVVQDLLALNAQLGNSEHSFEKAGNDGAVELCQRSREHVLHAVVQARRAVRGLRPPALRELGLWPSLREALPDLQASDPDIVLPEGSGPNLSEAKLVVLHRVAQEAIHNALRHAHATEVRVSFHATESHAVLEVRDDGRGFEVPERLYMLEKQDHFGLLSMEERISAQDGELQIESSPGEGTTIRCSLPLGA